MREIDPSFWKGRRVLVTGQLGFKGAWLCSLLSRFGARIWGYGQDTRTPLLSSELHVENYESVLGDINDMASFALCLERSDAEVVFHLAAQPIVLKSYDDPIATFEDNVMGTARVLQVARQSKHLRSVVVVTSDKVYRNTGSIWGYREGDALGGSDPYSASKAAAEILIESMARSFFCDPNGPAVATARAGNVIGGGDWAEFRLLPDAARELSSGEPLRVRNPHSTRPWQHVLDPLYGYMLLAENIACDGNRDFSSWNFGPAPEDVLSVGEVADLFVRAWGDGAAWISSNSSDKAPKEAKLLAVDSTLARTMLRWSPRWRVAESVRRTAEWYRDFADGIPAQTLVDRDIDAYLSPRIPA